MKKENNQNEWIHSTLEKVLETLMDGTHFSPQSKSGVFKYITSKNIRMGRLDLSNVDYISEEEHKKIYKSCPVKKGDVLLTKDGANTGNVTINTLAEEFSLLSSVAVLSGKKDTLDNRFLFQYLASSKSQYILKSEMAGQAITRLTLTTLKNIPIPLPPLPEQKKIAVILSTWDEAIEKLESLVALKEKRKKGLMQSLLTGKKRLKGFKTKAFKKTKIGMIPEDWEDSKIEEVLKIVSRPVEFNDEEFYPLISVRRRSGGLFHRETLQGKQIATKNLFLAKAGDFLISKMQIIHGATGKVTKDFDKMYISGSYLSLIPKNDSFSIDFFDYLSRTSFMLKAAAQSCSGVHIEKMTLNVDLFLKNKIVYPSNIAEQKRIAEVLNAADNEINLHKEEIEKIKLQKKGIMQKLLTGKVRV